MSKNPLLSFATAEEAMVVKALDANLGSQTCAADELGITVSAVRNRLYRLRKRAARRGCQPPVPAPVAESFADPFPVEDASDLREPVPEGHHVQKISTLLDAQGQIRAQWLQAPKDEQTRWDEFWKACERNAEKYKGAAEPTKAPKFSDADTCTVYPLGDPHIGMLSWAKETGQDFDLQIAERDLLRAVDLLVDRSPPSKLAILANVGDFFHAEGDDQRTPTGGNKLDCDTRSAKIVEVGFCIVRHLVDRLLEKHEVVIIVNVPGNHDPKLARMLNMWLSAVYEREPRVQVKDNRNPYMYIRHGKVLFGFAHGDGAKREQLPSIMAADEPTEWGCTEYRVWHTGHIHHETLKEFPGCTVESHRTLAARDYWHAWKGYRSGQSLSCITYHAEYGEITRSKVDIKLVRASS